MIGKLFLICAPSGAGKTTLVNALLSAISSKYNIERGVTYTSRAIRQGEVHAKDYFFITPQEFELKIKENFFLEWSDMYGTYYGSPLSILDNINMGKSIILIVDAKGVKDILAKYRQSVVIRILPPSLEILSNRLNIRSTETKSQIIKRLELAKLELEDQDFIKITKHTLINDDLNRALSEFLILIINEIKS